MKIIGSFCAIWIIFGGSNSPTVLAQPAVPEK